MYKYVCLCLCVCVRACAYMRAQNMNSWLSSEKSIFHLVFHEKKSVCSAITS